MKTAPKSLVTKLILKIFLTFVLKEPKVKARLI